LPRRNEIYHFEDVDLKEAKRILGDIACLMGGFSTHIVEFGTPMSIDEEVKKTLDIMASGGGYLFATSFAVESCPQENFEALIEAIYKYGKY
jgi:uroporphyrinogen-III decarboxylase